MPRHAVLCHVHAMSSAHLLVDCPAYRRELEVALHHWGGHRGELAGAGPGLDVQMRCRTTLICSVSLLLSLLSTKKRSQLSWMKKGVTGHPPSRSASCQLIDGCSDVSTAGRGTEAEHSIAEHITAQHVCLSDQHTGLCPERRSQPQLDATGDPLEVDTDRHGHDARHTRSRRPRLCHSIQWTWIRIRRPPCPPMPHQRDTPCGPHCHAPDGKADGA